jgi:hypothetical protein
LTRIRDSALIKRWGKGISQAPQSTKQKDRIMQRNQLFDGSFKCISGEIEGSQTVIGDKLYAVRMFVYEATGEIKFQAIMKHVPSGRIGGIEDFDTYQEALDRSKATAKHLQSEPAS